MSIWQYEPSPPFPFENMKEILDTQWNKVCELEYDAVALGEGSEVNENGRINRITGADGGFCDRGDLEIKYIRTANGALF